MINWAAWCDKKALLPNINRVGTETLPPGLYFWEVLAQGKRVQTGKIVKVGRD